MPQTGTEPYISAYIGIGSNQGDTACNLESARRALEAFPGARLGRLSSVYRTEPLDMPGQPFFANQVAELLCGPTVRPDALLDMMLAAELTHGRVRVKGLRYGPRSLDLDLLLFGDLRVDTAHLALPHPRMLERAFVLAPLAELEAELLLPQGMTVREALRRINHRIGEDGTIFQDSAGGPGSRNP